MCDINLKLSLRLALTEIASSRSSSPSELTSVRWTRSSWYLFRSASITKNCSSSFWTSLDRRVTLYLSLRCCSAPQGKSSSTASMSTLASPSWSSSPQYFPWSYSTTLHSDEPRWPQNQQQMWWWVFAMWHTAACVRCTHRSVRSPRIFHTTPWTPTSNNLYTPCIGERLPLVRESAAIQLLLLLPRLWGHIAPSSSFAKFSVATSDMSSWRPAVGSWGSRCWPKWLAESVAWLSSGDILPQLAGTQGVGPTSLGEVLVLVEQRLVKGAFPPPAYIAGHKEFSRHSGLISLSPLGPRSLGQQY